MGIFFGYSTIQFLSMKLASVNPILHDYGVAFEDCMSQQEVI